MFFIKQYYTQILIGLALMFTAGLSYKIYNLTIKLEERKQYILKMEKQFAEIESERLRLINKNNELIQEIDTMSNRLTENAELNLTNEIQTYDTYINTVIADLMNNPINKIELDSNVTKHDSIDTIYKVYENAIGEKI